MTIRQNINAVSERIRIQRASNDGASDLGDDVQDAAEAAIHAGQGEPPGAITDDWRKYMELFATNADELARLLPTDGSHTDTDLQRERAYLVANGTCGATTTDNLANGGVTVKLI